MNTNPKLLLGRDTGPVSGTVDIVDQMTITALGLEDTDEVTLWLVQITKLEQLPCACPPGKVQLPTVGSEVQMTCCGQPITLSVDRPFVIVDAPIGWRLRVKWNVDLVTTQAVSYARTNTHNVNDRMRGCPCEGAN